MKVEGFDLELNDYCEYCGYFYPQVEQVECRVLGDTSERYLNIIRCKNRNRCARIAENLENRINGKGKAQTTSTASEMVLV